MIIYICACACVYVMYMYLHIYDYIYISIYLYDYSFIHTGAYRISGLSGLVCGNIFENLGKSWKMGSRSSTIRIPSGKTNLAGNIQPNIVTSVATNQVMKLPTTLE